MPKFKVDGVFKEYYEELEIEASTKDEATAKYSEMQGDGKVEVAASTWKATARRVE